MPGLNGSSDRGNNKQKQSSRVIGHLRAVAKRVDNLDGVAFRIVVDRSGVALGSRIVLTWLKTGS